MIEDSGQILFGNSNAIVVYANCGKWCRVSYAHNKTILVKEGQAVTKGQKIAEMGNSDSDSVKLHFEIRQQGKPVDPSKYLPPR